MEWVESGRHSRPPPTEGENAWTLLIIDSDGARMIEKGCPYPVGVEYPFALGSGREVAYGAMDAGASPRRAIEIACLRDTGTSGAIMTIDIAMSLSLGQRAEPSQVPMAAE